MADQQQQEAKLLDPKEFSSAMTDILNRSHRILNDFLTKQASQEGGSDPDPLNIGNAFLELSTKLATDPVRLMNAQANLWQNQMELWQSASLRWLGQENEPYVKPEKDDHRFKDTAWNDIQLFDYIKQSYLLTSRWMQDLVAGVDGLEPTTHRKVEFYTKQFVDAMAPTNFVMTNPEVLRATAETGGENLIHGLQNLLEDMERGKGIRMTDEKAFEVGVNVAASKGKVIHRNELMELIQFSPSTEKVYKTPLLIVPPWINKYYILDLRPSNSFIKWATDQGHTVFIISWINPDEKMAGESFEDYMNLGPLKAIDIVTETTGQEKVNAIGYCLGGTLLAATLAYMAVKKDDRVESATFFTTLTDFKEAGDLSIFIDEKQLENIDHIMEEQGYLDGSEMATTFNMLRANDLIWSFVVHNYLLGKDPFPFDLLYWNSDSTRMPRAMHSFYLHQMYEKNKLVEPGGITLNGVDIDLHQVKTPIYMISTKEDHIAPWRATYAATQLYKGPVRFVLAGSGHIAGVVNPPASGKYGFWTNEKLPASPGAWLDSAKKNEGSWWTDWQKWIQSHAGGRKTVPARDPAKGKVKALCDAPGEYVRVRL